MVAQSLIGVVCRLGVLGKQGMQIEPVRVLTVTQRLEMISSFDYHLCDVAGVAKQISYLKTHQSYYCDCA